MNNCKHLACSEVRAALFTDRCKLSRSKVEAPGSSNNKIKADAQRYCVRNQAIEHLKEKNKCAQKAPKFVDYVFDKCSSDLAPFNKPRSSGLNNLKNVV